MKKTIVAREVTIPDLLRIRRYERTPELGPNILFFSGGTALNEISRTLKKFTHNSTHLVTPFDSGGSSAILRTAFDMPAIGDLRSRMMALADESIGGHPEVFNLFAYRLPKKGKRKELLSQLRNIASGKDERIRGIKNPMRSLIRSHLNIFLDHAPEKFDLRGASIGNLILAGGYLANDHQLDQVIFMFSKLVNVQGKVATIVNDNLHLGATLANKSKIIGQHLLTGKEVDPLNSPIKNFYLVDQHKSTLKTQAVLQRKKRKMIKEAELICYPPGSFYTSLCANLLPKGVGTAIKKNKCPKIYFPSLGNDPECIGMSLDEAIFKLLSVLKQDVGKECPNNQLLNFVFIDRENGVDLKKSTKKMLSKTGVQVVDTRLITPQSSPYYDPQLMVSALLSLS